MKFRRWPVIGIKCDFEKSHFRSAATRTMDHLLLVSFWPIRTTLSNEPRHVSVVRESRQPPILVLIRNEISIMAKYKTVWDPARSHRQSYITLRREEADPLTSEAIK